MKTAASVLLACICMAILAAPFALSHCGGAQAPPVSAVEEAAMFGAALQDCVSTATTRAQVDVCRASVEQTYCGPGGPLAKSSGCEPTDGGAE